MIIAVCALLIALPNDHTCVLSIFPGLKNSWAPVPRRLLKPKVHLNLANSMLDPSSSAYAAMRLYAPFPVTPSAATIFLSGA